jgi:hypothetical protein
MSTLRPVSEDFFDSAAERYSQQWIIDQPAAAVWEELVGEKPLHWCRGLDISWTSPRPFGVGTTREAKVLGGVLKVQEHFFLWEEGRRYAFHVTQANAPLFQSLAEDYAIEPRGPEQCAFTWTIALTPTALGRAGSALNRPLFNSFFNDTAKYFAAADVRSR